MTALLLTLLLFGPKAPKPPQLRATLFANHQAGNAPLTVRATVKVVDPDKVLRCGSVVWEWGNGWTEEVPIFQCDPYALLENVPARFSQTREMVYRRPGEYEIRATVRSSIGRAPLARLPLTVR